MDDLSQLNHGGKLERIGSTSRVERKEFREVRKSRKWQNASRSALEFEEEFGEEFRGIGLEGGSGEIPTGKKRQYGT